SDPIVLALERTGSAPARDANGFLGGFVGEGEKTVIPARAFAKVSLRLVPNQDPVAVKAAIAKHIQSLTTPGVEIEVKVLSSAPQVKCRVDNPVADALRAAYSEVFGKDTALIRIGGVLPGCAVLRAGDGASLLVCGVARAE